MRENGFQRMSKLPYPRWVSFFWPEVYPPPNIAIPCAEACGGGWGGGALTKGERVMACHLVENGSGKL